MNAIILAIVLIGEPQPVEKLYVGCHSGTWEAARINEITSDWWIACRFDVRVEEKDFMHPRWRTSARGQWMGFPCPKESPLGPFVTRGLAAGWFKPTLERHLWEMLPPRDWSAIENQYPWSYLEPASKFDVPLNPFDFKALVPVPAPAEPEGNNE